MEDFFGGLGLISLGFFIYFLVKLENHCGKWKEIGLIVGSIISSVFLVFGFLLSAKRYEINGVAILLAISSVGFLIYVFKHFKNSYGGWVKLKLLIGGAMASIYLVFALVLLLYYWSEGGERCLKQWDSCLNKCEYYFDVNSYRYSPESYSSCLENCSGQQQTCKYGETN